MFDLDILTRLDSGLDRIAPRQAGIAPTAGCPRMARASIEEVVRCPEMLARGICPAAHRDEVPA
ncbi:hypothetical protein [Rhodobaculum claviforme]|uniref:Uncharacterized protein n=1 Tax=Rhodobaculum claviforme TaxID=1549854 RepID=A0A934TKR8_9RHOB|nr:hypothetical protein [Rhodobaculum claviforme]MBK5927934.1 hypothetical protein [Rhodobaculum claviforme]